MSRNGKRRYCAFGCTDIGAYMHGFPHPERRPEMFEKWIATLGNKLTETDSMKIYRNKKVCANHFSLDQKVASHRLMHNAVPSLHLEGLLKSPTIFVQLEHNYSVPGVLTSNLRLELSKVDVNPTDTAKLVMTKGKTGGRVLNFDHLVFWVANAKTASSYFVTRFGFQPLAVREATDDKPIVSHAVRLNKITIVFESPTSTDDVISKELAAHGDFVKDVAFQVQDLEQLVLRAKEGGAEIVQDVTVEEDKGGSIRYAVLKTYGNTTHKLIDRTKYSGVFLPGYKDEEGDVLNELLPNTKLDFIDHVEGNMADGTLEDAVAWYEKNLNMHRFWCVDYEHDLVPYSSINSASVINISSTVLLSMNEAAKGLRPTSKASEFVKALGTSGVEHIALNTDDIITTMKNLKARGAAVITWPSTYYDLIRLKLKDSNIKVAESIDSLQELNILIDFDERGYMLQAFTTHLQARPTVFIEIIQRRNHRGFGAMNYKWVFEAIELLDSVKTEVKTEN